MNHIRNIIFDLDGTLVDSAEGVAAAINYSFEQTGLPVQDTATLAQYIGYPLWEMYRSFTDWPYEELHRHFKVRAAQTVVESTTMLPGAAHVLATLKQREYRLAVASTKIRPHIDGIVEKLGWRKMFATLVGGDEVSNVKPDPEILTVALERLGGSPADTALVGDTINDVKAAQAISMKVVGVASPYGGLDELKKSAPDHLVASVSEVLELFPALEDVRK